MPFDCSFWSHWTPRRYSTASPPILSPNLAPLIPQNQRCSQAVGIPRLKEGDRERGTETQRPKVSSFRPFSSQKVHPPLEDPACYTCSRKQRGGLLSMPRRHSGSTFLLSFFDCKDTSLQTSLDENSNSKRYVHPNVHSSIIYNSQDMETT